MLEHSYSSSSSLDYRSALVAIDSYIRIVFVLSNVMLITTTERTRSRRELAAQSTVSSLTVLYIQQT